MYITVSNRRPLRRMIAHTGWGTRLNSQQSPKILQEHEQMSNFESNLIRAYLHRLGWLIHITQSIWFFSCGLRGPPWILMELNSIHHTPYIVIPCHSQWILLIFWKEFLDIRMWNFAIKPLAKESVLRLTFTVDSKATKWKWFENKFSDIVFYSITSHDTHILNIVLSLRILIPSC